jgi:hypothetical protein
LLVNLGSVLATDVGNFVDIDKFVGSASTADVLAGPTVSAVRWTLSGANQGTVNGTSFEGFENLNGAPDNADAFYVEAGGSLSGTLRGGVVGTDGVIVVDPNNANQSTAYQPATDDAAGSFTLYGKTFQFEGLDAFSYVDTTDPANPVVKGTIFDDTIRVFKAGSDLKVEVGGETITFDSGQVVALKSLRIEGRDGTDKITVESLPDDFTADLRIYGSRLPALASVAPIPAGGSLRRRGRLLG